MFLVLKQVFFKSHFSHQIRQLGHDPATMEVNGIEYAIGMVCGETTLLPCPNACPHQRVFYVTLDHPQSLVLVAYECSVCGFCAILEYTDQPVPSEEERLFVVELGKIIMHRVESQLGSRLEKNIFYNRVLWNNPDPYGAEPTPPADIPSPLLANSSFWKLLTALKILVL